MTYKYSNDVRLRGNPAIVNINTGEVLLNKKIWTKLSDYEKVLVLLHEEGHYANRSIDEIKADAYMIDKYLQECDTSKRRYEIVKTIFGNVGNDKENIERKIQLVQYLLDWDDVSNIHSQDECKRLKSVLKDKDFYASFDPLTIVSVVGTVIDLGIKGYGLWQQYNNRTEYWDDLGSTERKEILSSAVQTVIQEEFLQCGGNFNKLLTYANMSPGETNSIACKTFELIARTVPIDSKIFGGNVEISLGQASQIWWSKQGYTLPKWIVDWCYTKQEELEDLWNSLSFFDKVKYSTEYKVYVALFIVILVLIWKYL